MKKISILVITLFLAVIAFGQQHLSEKELIGEWEPISTVNNSGDKRLDGFTKSFKETLFEFKANHRMNIQSLSNDYMFKMYLASTKNAKWEIEKKTNRVKIGEKSRENAISYIDAFKENGKVYFLYEGIKIEVKKL